MSIEHKTKTKYVPLVSFDVERNFSVFKAFFRDNITCMSEEAIEVQIDTRKAIDATSLIIVYWNNDVRDT